MFVAKVIKGAAGSVDGDVIGRGNIANAADAARGTAALHQHVAACGDGGGVAHAVGTGATAGDAAGGACDAQLCVATSLDIDASTQGDAGGTQDGDVLVSALVCGDVVVRTHRNGACG